MQKENDNRVHKGKMAEIYSKYPLPEINNEFMNDVKRTIMCSYLKKKEDERLIKIENSKLFKRITKTNATIDPYELDKDYKDNHIKLLKRIRKIGTGLTLLDLPKISEQKSPKKKLFKNSSERIFTNIPKIMNKTSNSMNKSNSVVKGRNESGSKTNKESNTINIVNNSMPENKKEESIKNESIKNESIKDESIKNENIKDDLFQTSVKV